MSELKLFQRVKNWINSFSKSKNNGSNSTIVFVVVFNLLQHEQLRRSLLDIFRYGIHDWSSLVSVFVQILVALSIIIYRSFSSREEDEELCLYLTEADSLKIIQVITENGAKYGLSQDVVHRLKEVFWNEIQNQSTK